RLAADRPHGAPGGVLSGLAGRLNNEPRAEAAPKPRRQHDPAGSTTHSHAARSPRLLQPFPRQLTRRAAGGADPFPGRLRAILAAERERGVMFEVAWWKAIRALRPSPEWAARRRAAEPSP